MYAPYFSFRVTQPSLAHVRGGDAIDFGRVHRVRWWAERQTLRKNEVHTHIRTYLVDSLCAAERVWGRDARGCACDERPRMFVLSGERWYVHLELELSRIRRRRHVLPLYVCPRRRP